MGIFHLLHKLIKGEKNQVIISTDEEKAPNQIPNSLMIKNIVLAKETFIT